MKKPTKKQLDRHEFLYNEALGRFLDKMDWDLSDWLSDEDFKEYNELNKIISGYCMICGDEPCVCEPEKGGKK